MNKNSKDKFIRFSVVFIYLFTCIGDPLYGSEIPNDLNLTLAQSMTVKAMTCGIKNGWKLSIAIVNSEGNLISFQRSDGSYAGSIDAAIDKAKSANSFQRSTRLFAESVRSGNLGLLSVKGIIANEGGIPIVLNGIHAGAIGISGAKSIEDEKCAIQAIQ